MQAAPPVGAGALIPRASARTPVAAELELARRELVELRLAVVDNATGRPVASAIELWQLDLPGDRDFTAGDRLHGRLDVPAEGMTLSVPVGRYRAFQLGRRTRSEDPPGFEVTAGGAQAVLPIDPPRVARYALDLRDVDGRRIGSARLKRSSASVRRKSASFAEERRSRHPQRGSSNCHGIGCAVGDPDPEVTRGEEGFDAGVHSELTPMGGTRSLLRFTAAGTESVLFRAPDFGCTVRKPDAAEPVETRTMVAVALPVGYFDQAIRLQDGTPARQRGAHITLECKPLQVEPGSPPDLWRSCPIAVRVTLANHQTLRFTYRVSEGPPAARTMLPHRRR